MNDIQTHNIEVHFCKLDYIIRYCGIPKLKEKIINGKVQFYIKNSHLIMIKDKTITK